MSRSSPRIYMDGEAYEGEECTSLLVATVVLLLELFWRVGVRGRSGGMGGSPLGGERSTGGCSRARGASAHVRASEKRVDVVVAAYEVLAASAYAV